MEVTEMNAPALFQSLPKTRNTINTKHWHLEKQLFFIIKPYAMNTNEFVDNLAAEATHFAHRGPSWMVIRFNPESCCKRFLFTRCRQHENKHSDAVTPIFRFKLLLPGAIAKASHIC
jgi:hypothetical protein